MSFFGFGKKDVIKSTVFKISTGLAQLEKEYNEHREVTSMLRGILIALRSEKIKLETLIKSNGKTDCTLLRTLTVKEWNGEEISLESFTTRLNNRAKKWFEITGIDIRIWLFD